jgi:hypothetical protein
MIEQCRWVPKSQILDRPPGAVGVSSSPEIARWPNGDGAALFLRRTSSFGPAGGDWLRKELLEIWSTKIESDMSSSRSRVISVRI